MNANSFEIQGSQAACLLDELDGKLQIDAGHWRGYHPSVYCSFATKDKADTLVATLCEKLKDRDVSKYSLEMQTWYRDHVLLDKKNATKDEDTFLEFKKTVLEEVALHGELAANIVSIELKNGNIDITFQWESLASDCKVGFVLQHRVAAVAVSDFAAGINHLARRITNDLMIRRRKAELTEERVQAAKAVEVKMTEQEKRLVKVVPR